MAELSIDTPKAVPARWPVRADSALLAAIGARWAGALWLLPLLVALLFAALVLLWAQRNDAIDLREQTDAITVDTLSLEAQLRGRLETEAAKLRAVAARLPAQPGDAQPALRSMPEVAAGLDRLWMSLVWVDANNQVRAQVQRQPASEGDTATSMTASGQTLHLVAPVGRAAEGNHSTVGNGRLVARYDPADLLKSKDFWWLALKYDVDLVTGLGEIIASTADGSTRATGLSHEKVFEPITDATLRLTRRQALRPWYRNLRTLVLIGGVLLLSVAAAILLRRQMARTARAELDSRTEAAWRQSMEESALVGLRARAFDGRILYVNKTLCEMVGYAREELLGLVPPLPFWRPEAVDEMMSHNRLTLQGQAPRSGFEARWRHREGHELDVMVFESPLVDAAGLQVGWMGSIVDITSRKRLEDMQRRQMEVMANHARLTTLGEVASTLAHELNQPLTAISGYSTGLSIALKAHPGIDPMLLAALDDMTLQSAQAGRIVHRIRERLSRRATVRAPFDLNVTVCEALDLLKRQLAQAGIRVTKGLEASLPMVIGDRVGIEQVVTNLVRNAADALGQRAADRHIHVATSVESAQQDAFAMQDARVVRLSVRDNGPGLQGRSVDTLCTSFYSTKHDGLGIGLAICRSIVEAHDGTLVAHEADGGGAVFGFALPSIAPAGEAMAASA